LHVSKSPKQKYESIDVCGVADENSLSGSVTFSDEARNNSAGCILCIKSIAQLLAGRIVLLLQGKSLQNKSIPLVLKGVKKRGDGGLGRESRRGCLWA
jgi:hypothetical protein